MCVGGGGALAKWLVGGGGGGGFMEFAVGGGGGGGRADIIVETLSKFLKNVYHKACLVAGTRNLP